jgi:hypothetical protein
MPTYRVAYTRITTGRIYFTADNITEAEDLIEAYECGEIDQEDLPNQSERDLDFEYNLEMVEEA